MRVVYKYKLSTGVTEINMPSGAKVVDFNFQGNEAFLWAEINTDSDENVKRTFEVYGTGERINGGFEYLKTCHVTGFVFHLYELTH